MADAQGNAMDLDAALREVSAALRTNKSTRAVEIACAALERGFEHPRFLALRSARSQQGGLLEPALADLRRAMELAPEDIEIRNAYGALLGRAVGWDQAADIFEGSLRLAPNNAIVHFLLASAREELRELAAARRHFERAAALSPGFVEPLTRLAAQALNRDDPNAARALSARALALRPGDFAAIVVEARLAIAGAEFERAEDLCRRLIAAAPQASQDGAIARGVLGDLRHAQERYPQAFAAYTARNRAIFDLNARRFGDEAQAYCRWLSRIFFRNAFR